MDIKFGDLSREFHELEEPLSTAVLGVMRRGWFVLGPEVEQFETAFARHHRMAHAVGVASGTDALALALRACGVGAGDEVLTVPLTAVPTASAISMTGATPRFVDCERKTRLMDITRVEACLTSRTKAIIPVHLYGLCVDMDPLLEIAAGRGLPVIEDCAQSQGAMYKGRMAGTMGLFGCFSFYPSKNLGCYGDGGAIVTNASPMADMLRKLRNYGQRERYRHEIKGVNSRLDEVQAAILRVKLPHVDAWNERRRLLAARYTAALANMPLELPSDVDARRHVYHLYAVNAEKRDELQAHLARSGVQTLIHYPRAVHLQEAYSDLGYRAGSFPVAEQLAATTVSLPLYPQLKDEEVDYVAGEVRSFFKS